MDSSEWIFGTYKLNVHTWLGLLLLCMIFYLYSYSGVFFSSSLLNYRFPYCIQLYTWSTQQVIVAHCPPYLTFQSHLVLLPSDVLLALLLVDDLSHLDRRIEDNIRKLTTVCLPYVKGLPKRIQKICSPYDIRTVFTNGSTLQKYLFRVKPPTEFNIIKNCVYSIPCNCGKIYKDETGCPTKSKARRTSEGSSTRWDWKVGYGRPYMEGKGKPSALMG